MITRDLFKKPPCLLMITRDRWLKKPPETFFGIFFSGWIHLCAVLRPAKCTWLLSRWSRRLLARGFRFEREDTWSIYPETSAGLKAGNYTNYTGKFSLDVQEFSLSLDFSKFSPESRGLCLFRARNHRRSCRCRWAFAAYPWTLLQQPLWSKAAAKDRRSVSWKCKVRWKESWNPLKSDIWESWKGKQRMRQDMTGLRDFFNAIAMDWPWGSEALHKLWTHFEHLEDQGTSENCLSKAQFFSVYKS